MKIANKILAIMPLIIGLGATATASANDQDLLASVNKTVELQSQQVTQSIAAQLKQSFQADILVMAKHVATQWTDKQPAIARINSMQVQNTTTTQD